MVWKIEITGKLTSFKRAFVQGEQNATLVEFTVPNKLDGVSLEGLTWEVRTTSPDNNIFWKDALLPQEGDTIICNWLVNKNHTSKAGALIVVLEGREGDNVKARFVVEGLQVLAVMDGINPPSPDYFNEILDKIEYYNYHPFKVGENGNVWNYNPETGQYEDSGVTVDKGPKGDTGDTGAQGSQGVQGIAGEIGVQGDTGPKGDTGTSFTIMGTYNTLAALEQAQPTPNVGDAYSVGAAPPYNIYTWDGVNSVWQNQGQLQGPKGDKGDAGAQGAKGDIGEQGVQGNTGAQGEQGAKGDPGITEFAVAPNGTVLELTGTGDNGKFVSPADYTKGDTFEVNGTAYTMQMQDGSTPQSGMFVAGAVVPFFLDGGKINFIASSSGKSTPINIISPEEMQIGYKYVGKNGSNELLYKPLYRMGIENVSMPNTTSKDVPIPASTGHQMGTLSLDYTNTFFTRDNADVFMLNWGTAVSSYISSPTTIRLASVAAYGGFVGTIYIQYCKTADVAKTKAELDL